MQQYLAQIALLVKEYDEAIEFYTKKMGFVLIEDTVLSPTKRWVLVAPPGTNSCRLLLAKADGETQEKSIGNQSGGRVFLFLHTDDFWRDYNLFKQNNIRFKTEPIQQEYGTVAVFEDLYGNGWDLIEPTKNRAH